MALYKEAVTWPPRAGISGLLVIAAFNSFHGAFAVERGHEYYRSTRKTKASLEEKLGLNSLAIQSTPGMQRDVHLAVEGTPGTGAQRFWSITTQAIWLLRLIGTLSAVGALYAAYASYLVF